ARKALLTAISGKVKDSELLILDELKLSVPKTKEMAKIMANFPQVKSGIFIANGKNDDIKIAGRNLSNLKIIGMDNLNILDILKYKFLILTKDGVDYLNKKYGAAN
ncbi:MAG: 50S ribosomal protein L4, partial [Patescibacteria group bacterium]